jgi:hypothetical protein
MVVRLKVRKFYFYRAISFDDCSILFNSYVDKDLAALNESMRSQHQSFMVITGRVATLHEEMDKFREKYLKFRRIHFHDNSSPFETQKELSIDCK